MIGNKPIGIFFTLIVFMCIYSCGRKPYMGQSFMFFEEEYRFEVVESFSDRGAFFIVPKEGNLMYILPNDVSKAEGYIKYLSNSFSRNYWIHKEVKSREILFIRASDTIPIEFELIPYKNKLILGFESNE